MRKELGNLWNLVEPVVTGAGFELVELEYGRELSGWVLRVFIDRPYQPGPYLPGQEGQESDVLAAPSVTHENCEAVSRDLSATLDVADVIPTAYSLEVSSPGIERPLRREKDFDRFRGQKAKIRTTDAVEGRRNFSGTLQGADKGVVTIECDGRSYQIPVDRVARANLVPDWTAEFRRAERSAQ